MNDKIKIAVCDDDKFYTEKIEKSLNAWFSDKNRSCSIETFSSASGIFSEKADFDLILLDIDMPEITGIEAAEKLRNTDKTTAIVFVSNMQSFVFETIKYKPFRFIRKQFLDNELDEMLEAFIKTGENIYFEVTDENGRLCSVKATDISYIEAFRHDIVIHAAKKSYKANKTLSELEKILCESGFIRIHKSFLVNYRSIYEIAGGYAVTDSGDKLTISRYRIKDVKDTYLKMSRSDIL
jgi:DNA-binding LytR/AlgR family response regulator